MVNKRGNSREYGFLILFALIFLVSIFSVGSTVADDTSESEAKLSEEINATNNETAYKPFVDPRVLEQFNISSEIPVIIEVRDTSGISVSSKDSIEQQNIKDPQRKEFLGSKTDSVLSKLPADELKLKGKFITGRGFYGSITKAAFDKLINDSDVGAIYYDGKAYVGGWRVATEEELKSAEIVASTNATAKHIEKNFSTNMTDNKITYNITQPSKSGKSWLHKLISFLKSLFGLKS